VTAIGIGTTGNRLAFAICGILAVIASAFAWLVLPTVRPLLRPRLSRPRLPGLSVSRRSITALLVSSVGQGARGAVSLTLVPLIAAGSMGLAGPRVGVFLTTAYLTEVAVTAIGGGWSDRHGRRPVVLLGTGAGIFAMILLGVAVRTGSMIAFFAATLPIGIAGGCMLGLLPAVLVDLAGGPEAGLSANRIARDFGSTSCTVIIGAITGLAGTTGGLITGVLMFVVVAIGIRVIGETRALQS
jgi:MFS family permease